MKGEDLKNYSEKQLDEYRNIKIGIIFQQYNLLSDMNVYENLRLVLELQEWDCGEGERKKYIDDKISDILNIEYCRNNRISKQKNQSIKRW